MDNIIIFLVFVTLVILFMVSLPAETVTKWLEQKISFMEKRLMKSYKKRLEKLEKRCEIIKQKMENI